MLFIFDIHHLYNDFFMVRAMLTYTQDVSAMFVLSFLLSYIIEAAYDVSSIFLLVVFCVLAANECGFSQGKIKQDHFKVAAIFIRSLRLLNMNYLAYFYWLRLCFHTVES